MTTPIRAYHFFGERLRDGRPVPADGERLTAYDQPLKLCSYGLHASRHPADALRYAPGSNLALVDLSGDVLEGDDKLCASERTIIARIDATPLLRQFAREQALSVLHLWDAPGVVRRYLETGDESLRVAAWAAAWDTEAAAKIAWTAAWTAEGAADCAAAWDAAWAAARAASRDAADCAAWNAARIATRVAAKIAAKIAVGGAVEGAVEGAAWDTAWDTAWGTAKRHFRALVEEAFGQPQEDEQ